MEVYRFPALAFILKPWVIVAAILISIASALVGTLHSLWRAAKQPPAEAMRPEPPAKYQITLLEKMGIGRALSQPSRIIVRNIERKPIQNLAFDCRNCRGLRHNDLQRIFQGFS